MEFWFLLPVGVLIAVFGMSSGIEGSNFWIPVYLLWLSLEPRVAFWVSLLTMLFGFGSGMVRNLRAGTVHWPLVRRYFALAAPAVVIGSLLSTRVPVAWILLSFAIFVAVYGASLVREFIQRQWFDRGGDEQVAHGRFYPLAGLAGGFLHGSIATGSGTLMMPALLDHRDIDHHAKAVGSAVVLAFGCALLAIFFRIDGAFLEGLVEQRQLIFRIMIFSAPGVIIGGQLGPRLAQWIPRRYLRVYVGILLIAVGTLVGLRAGSA